jgi:hypothetical protein
LSLLAGQIATIKHTLGVNLLVRDADKILKDKLHSIRRDGCEQIFTSSSKLEPLAITRLNRLGSALLTLRTVGVNPINANAGEVLKSLLLQLRSEGAIGLNETRQLRPPIVSGLACLQALSLGVHSLQTNAGFNLFAFRPSRSLSSLTESVSSVGRAPLWSRIISGSFGSMLRLPGFEQLALLNGLFTGLCMMCSVMGMEIIKARGSENLFQNLRLIKASGACRAIAATPLDSAHAEGIASRHAVASGFQTIKAASGIDLADRDAVAQLTHAMSNFHKNGQSLVNAADYTHNLLPALSYLSQFGTVIANAKKLATQLPRG